VVVEAGRCGWGRDNGLFPEFRLGWVRVMFCRDPIIDTLRHTLAALRAARAELAEHRRRPRIVPAPPPAGERR
jgi:hypothetical protein